MEAEKQLVSALAIALLLAMKLIYDKIFSNKGKNHEVQATKTYDRLLQFQTEMQRHCEKNDGVHVNAKLAALIPAVSSIVDGNIDIQTSVSTLENELGRLVLIVNHLDDMHRDPNTPFATVELEKKVDSLTALVNELRVSQARV